MQLTRRKSKEQLKRKVRKWKRHKKERKGRGEKKGKEWRRAKEEKNILIKTTEEEVIFAVGSVVMGPLAFSLLVVLLE